MHDVSDRMVRLEREVSRLRLALGGVIVVGAAAAGVAAMRAPEVLRAKGLVIVDAQGRDRILLGAPVPASRNRKRQDAATASLVVLGADGADRVVVGQTPSPVIGGRVYPRPLEGWGLGLYDPKGDERGGMVFLGDSRVAVALDYPGGDAMGMFVDDKAGRAVLALNHPPAFKAPESALEVTAGGEGDPQLVMHDAKGRVILKAP